MTCQKLLNHLQTCRGWHSFAGPTYRTYRRCPAGTEGMPAFRKVGPHCVAPNALPPEGLT